MARPTPQQIRLIAARAFMPERKVREVYRGIVVREATYLRVLQAARDTAAPWPPSSAPPAENAPLRGLQETRRS
jgi:hypothetical protein